MIHRLDGRSVTLLLLQRETGLPEIVHWGRRLDGLVSDAAISAARRRRVRRNGPDVDYVEATLLPTAGATSLRAPALLCARDGRDWTADFETCRVRSERGRLVIDAVDEVARLALSITLELPPDGDVLVARSTIHNEAATPLDILHFAPCVFLLPADASNVLTFDGHWGREFCERRLALSTGRVLVENRRGRTSHDRQPTMFAGRELDEDRGEVWGVHLGWSGNHVTSAEMLEDGRVLVTTGEMLHPGEVRLASGECLASPSAYGVYSAEGLAGASRALHAYLRAHLLSWPEPRAPRPVTMNTWEGNYFTHDVTRLMRQAEAARRLGIERFVLDDGWMRGRDHDRAGLGDWQPDARKYPDGLGPLIDHVRGLGLRFGLWVEPEMVNPDSELYRAYPDATLTTQGRRLVTARNQLVLDLSRPEIFERIFGDLDALLRAYPIESLKWDMNRDLIAASGADGRPAYRRHVLATWALIDRLRTAHPSVEIESCASGGGRTDWGILSRAHRVWASDCTDALDRLSIQRGLSRWLPPELIGAHVSASPNHETGRRHAIAFRCAVALFFHFGIELDPLTLTVEDERELIGWIDLHKRLRPLLHGGGIHQTAAFSDGRSLCGVVSIDRGHAAFLVAQETSATRRLPAPQCFPGLEESAAYRVSAPAPQAAFQIDEIGGGVLSAAGLSLPVMRPESALVLEFERIS